MTHGLGDIRQADPPVQHRVEPGTHLEQATQSMFRVCFSPLSAENHASMSHLLPSWHFALRVRTPESTTTRSMPPRNVEPRNGEKMPRIPEGRDLACYDLSLLLRAPSSKLPLMSSTPVSCSALRATRAEQGANATGSGRQAENSGRLHVPTPAQFTPFSREVIIFFLSVFFLHCLPRAFPPSYCGGKRPFQRFSLTI